MKAFLELFAHLSISMHTRPQIIFAFIQASTEAAGSIVATKKKKTTKMKPETTESKYPLGK
jgi:hypothetical protein